MSAPLRLGLFAVALAAVFAVAGLAGDAFGPNRHVAAAASTAATGGDPHATAADSGDDADDGERVRVAAQPVRGLAVSQDGSTLELDRRTAQRGRRFELAFRINGRDGRAVRVFDETHTKRMHLIIVRRDLAGFQHLHPTMAVDGTWSTPVTLPNAGSYRVFADFSTRHVTKTLAADLQVDGPVTTAPLPASVGTVTADGLRVTFDSDAAHAGQEAELAFTVTDDGRPVTVQNYLGAKGHLVALREGDLAFLHVHPDEDRLRFMAEFPSPGRYRLFLQFQTGGRIHTAALTEEVSR